MQDKRTLSSLLDAIVDRVWQTLPSTHSGALAHAPNDGGAGNSGGGGGVGGEGGGGGVGGRRRGSLTRRYFRKRRFSSLEDARGNPIGFLANSLRLQRCLLVLDGCDEAMQDPEFKHFLGRLLDEVSRLSMVAAKLVSHGVVRVCGRQSSSSFC